MSDQKPAETQPTVSDEEISVDELEQVAGGLLPGDNTACANALAKCG